jgi:hypothetical protein
MDLSPEQARSFVGPRAEYYVARWPRAGDSRALGFNWAAFFLGFVWLLYRRMYLWFWIAIGLVFVLGFVEELLLMTVGVTQVPLLDTLITIAIASAFGTFGTYWYYLHARRQVKRLNQGAEPSLETLSRAGGTSWVAPTVGIVAFVILLALGAWADTLAP